MGDLGSIPGLERSPGEGNGYPFIFWPGEFHGQRSLAGYSPWGRKESDMTERLSLHFIHHSESESEVAQSCLTLCDPMDCSLPSSSVHGILQARILEWVAICFSSGYF